MEIPRRSRIDLLIQKVADKMDEKRGAGQSSKILTQGLDPCEGGRSGERIGNSSLNETSPSADRFAGTLDDCRGRR